MNAQSILTGVLPAGVLMFTFSVLQVEMLAAADVPQGDIVAWVATSWFIGGVIALVLSLHYKMPIAGAWSIPGFILVATTMANSGMPLAEAFGGFWMSGALVLLLGVTGTMKLIVRLLPQPVMLAMVAGILIGFPIDMMRAIPTSPVIVVAGNLGYVVFDLLRGPFRRIPGIAGTIVFCLVAAGIQGQLDFGNFSLSLGSVSWHTPSFTLQGFVSIAIPLTLLVVGAENMQATGILKAAGNEPPVNSMTILSGLGGLAAAASGTMNANIAGPTTAVVNSPDAGPAEGRYVASSFSGLSYMTLGVLAGTVVSLIGALPPELATVLLGMVLVKVVMDTIRQAWGDGTFAIGAFFAFIIALSDLSFLGISSPFWSLLGGAVAALLFDFSDYRDLVRDVRSRPDTAETHVA
jgi:benzoate membrane transport protein